MAASSPPGSISRLSQLFHRSRSISSSQRDETADSEDQASTTAESRNPISARQKQELHVGSLSSSMTIPTRSYFQRHLQHSIASTEVHPPSPRGVREETAELASRALADTISSPSHPPLLHAYTDQQIPLSTDSQPSSSKDVRKQQSTASINLPAAIPEVTEPALTPPIASAGRDGSSMLTQMIRSSPPDLPEHAIEDATEDEDEYEDDFTAVTVRPAIISQPHERTALLHPRGPGKSRSYGLQDSTQDIEGQGHVQRIQFGSLASRLRGWRESTGPTLKFVFSPKTWNKKTLFEQAVVRPASCLPAVLLGLLLNILDALSYGMILFPLGTPMFADLGPDGISMFYVSCIVAQLVYSLGGSVFRGGVGSEMIEVVPFFHKMAFTIMQHVGEQNPQAVLATTVLSYSISSILTGIVFFLLGQCKLGVLIGFFPRHILIGCIGGVGWFLVATGIEVSARLDGNLEYNFTYLRHLFEPEVVILWIIPLILAACLFVVKRWINHSLTDAAWFVSIILIFYIVVAAVPNLSIDELRATGWIFETPAAGVPWYHFYSLYDFKAVDWTALGQTVPAMFALTFFGVLHVPINIPALGLSTGEDNVDVDRELKAHGYSNALSGLTGSIQNYLVYTNTVLFMRSGGDSRLAGVLLAIATFGILVAGPAIVGFIPVMVVGTLIFYLGLDLMREALLDTIGRVHRIEYLTIVIIVVTMGAYDFVVGILVGIVLACVSFVVQTSQISAIRGTLPGGLASSMVRRHPMQHRFLQEVGRQIYVMKLAGYLFFGTIVGVENSVRAVLRDDEFNTRPLQFLVIDLSKVDGVDFSAAEAFTRINRILNARDVRMVLCGFQVSSDVGHSLQNVGLLGYNEDGIEFFEVLNSALEHCENELLKGFYHQRAALSDKATIASTDTQPRTSEILAVPVGNNSNSSFPPEAEFSSPRRGQLRTAATITLQEQERIMPPSDWQKQPQPLQLILQTFANISSQDIAFWKAAVPYFRRRAFERGQVLYQPGDMPDGFYLLESGILRAAYEHAPHGAYTEVIAPGATCGELPFFADTRRTATVLAEHEAVAWVLEPEAWQKCQKQQPELAAEMLKIGLRLTNERMQALTKYMLLAGK